MNKGKQSVTKANGEVVNEAIQYRGYESHMSLNVQSRLITGAVPTSGSAADDEQFPKLLAQDEHVGVNAQI